jgi:formylglycine-generating enzyme required for sulfatase activity
MITSEEVYGQYEPGQVIQDPLQGLSGFAPPMMVIGSGSFLMGAPAEDRDRRDSESPLHRVRIDRGFAMAMQEVTVGQFRIFVRSSGYRTDAEHDGKSSVWDDSLGRLSDREAVNWRHDFRGQPADDTLPVLRVSWNDAQAYVRWLTQVTGQVYRLPTEAEFEYALRAGVRDRHWWGDGRPRETVENLAGEDDRSTSGRRFSKAIRGYGDGYFGPAPAGRFIANPWGLFDMAGNVSEWVQDCWHSSYLRAPADGSAWENPGCTRRVVRGGYWASSESQARSSARNSASADFHAGQLGFRVVREL